MSAPIVSFPTEDSDVKNDNNHQASNPFDSSTVFAPSVTSLRSYSQKMTVKDSSNNNKSAEISFDWNTHQDNIFQALVEEIMQALGLTGSPSSYTLIAIVDDEAAPLLGDSQLRSLLLLTSQKAESKVLISIGSRRRSIMSQAVQVTCTSSISGEAFGETGYFSFRFQAGNAQLLTDFKVECMDALDLFGTAEYTFDIHVAKNNNDATPVMSSAEIEKALQSALESDSGTASLQVKLVPAGQTFISAADGEGNSTRNNSVVDADNLFAPSVTSIRERATTITVVNSENRESKNIDFIWDQTQDGLFADLCDQIKKALNINIGGAQTMSLTVTIQDESFQIFGDNQLRNMLVSIGSNTPIKITVGSRRRSIMSQAVQVSCTSSISGEAFGETGNFRFRFLPGNTELLSDFKAECMDALDLFGTDENSFDIHLRQGGADDFTPLMSSSSVEQTLEKVIAADGAAAALQVKLVPAGQTFISAADGEGNSTRNNSVVDADNLFAPSVTSIRERATTITVVNSENRESKNIDFIWDQTQDGLFADLCDQIKKALNINIGGAQTMSLTVTIQDESFQIFGDNQLRNMLVSIGSNTPIKITVGSRRRSIMSQAVQVSCTSSISGEAFGETGNFRFRFMPGNNELLTDFKVECMDALDLFGTAEYTFDIHVAKNNNDYSPVMSSAEIEKVLQATLEADGAAASLQVKLVPAGQTVSNDNDDQEKQQTNVIDADNIFAPSFQSMRNYTKEFTAVNGETGAKADHLRFDWNTHQDTLYNDFCDLIREALKMPSLGNMQAMQLTCTFDGESFPIFGDNQLRNMLIQVKDKYLKVSVSTRRRSVGSVLSRAIMCSVVSAAPEAAEGESANFRFRFLPTEENEILSNFKCEIIDALDLFGTEESAFDVEMKVSDDLWCPLTTSAELKKELDKILANEETAVIHQFRIVAAAAKKSSSSVSSSKRNSPTAVRAKIALALGMEYSHKYEPTTDDQDLEADLMDPQLLQSLTSATAGVFHLSTASAIRLFGVSEDGEKRELCDDDSARSALAEKLRIVAVSGESADPSNSANKQRDADNERFAQGLEQVTAQPVPIKLAVTLARYTINNSNQQQQQDNNNGQSEQQSEISSSAPVENNNAEGEQQRPITFDFETELLGPVSEENGSLHALRKACAKQLNLDLFAGDALELYVQLSSDQEDPVELTSDKHVSAAASAAKQQNLAEPSLFIKYKASLHPSRRKRYITVRATEVEKKGVEYVEQVDSVYEFSPITQNPNMMNELRSLVARSLRGTIALRHVQMSEINDEKTPYILEANLDGEWVVVSSNRAATAMFRALTENSAGHVSLRIKTPLPPPQDWELAISVFYHGSVFRHNVSYIEGTTANLHVTFTELKRLCNVPYDKLDVVSLDEALPATRADRSISDDDHLTRLFKEAIEQKFFPETFRRVITLRIEDTLSQATVNAERSESDKRKVKSVHYTASFQGASSIHPQDGRVDIDVNKKTSSILGDLKDLLLDNLRVPRLSGDEIGIFMSAKAKDYPQHMMDDQQLIDFLNLIGDDNTPDNRLQIIFRQQPGGSGDGSSRTMIIRPSSPNTAAANAKGIQMSRADILEDIANCWIELAGGSGASSIINMEDVRITFTTWTAGRHLDPQQTCLKKYNETSAWCGQVSSTDILSILREIVSHLSDFALSDFRAHARDMANFVEDVSSSAQSNRMLAIAFRAYAVDSVVTRDFLLRGLVDSELTSQDKAESVLASYGENLSEDDFVEVLQYFVGDDSLLLHKILCAAAPKRPHWIGSPRKDQEVIHRQETRLRIELRHVMDYQYPESLINFFKTFNDDTGSFQREQERKKNNKDRSIVASTTTNQQQQKSRFAKVNDVSSPTKQQREALSVRAIAWIIATLLQHPCVNTTPSSNNGDENNDADNSDDIDGETSLDKDHEGAWNWFRAFIRNEESAQNFLTMLSSTERVPVSRNTLALVASRLLSKDLERGSLLSISPVVAQLGQWCILVLQLSCLTRDIAWPPEFIPSQPDFEKMSARSPRARRIVNKNLEQSPPRDTEAYRLAGVSPRRPRSSSPDRNNTNNNENKSRSLVIAPSPPTSPPAGSKSARYQPRAGNMSSTYGLAKTDTLTKSLDEVMRSAAQTRNAAAGAVLQSKLQATHFLFTIAGASDLGATGGKICVSVLDDSAPKSGESNGNDDDQTKTKKEIFRTPAVASGSSNFPIAASRFLVPISGSSMAYVFQVIDASTGRFISACRWAVSQSGADGDFDESLVKPQNDKLALKLGSNEDGRGGSSGAGGHLALMITRQKELAYVPKDITNCMLQINLDAVEIAKQQRTKVNPRDGSVNEDASSDSDEEDAAEKAAAKKQDNSFIQGVNEMGDVIFTLGGKDGSGSLATNRTAVVELERALPFVTIQRVNPQVAGGDDVTDTVDITATKFVASRSIEEALKPVIKFDTQRTRSLNEDDSFKFSNELVRNGPPLVVKFTSIGFELVDPPPEDLPLPEKTREANNGEDEEEKPIEEEEEL